MQNGKGDKDRTTDRKAFRSNYDEINWGEKYPLNLERKDIQSYLKKIDATFVDDKDQALIQVTDPEIK